MNTGPRQPAEGRPAREQLRESSACKDGESRALSSPPDLGAPVMPLPLWLCSSFSRGSDTCVSFPAQSPEWTWQICEACSSPSFSQPSWNTCCRIPFCSPHRRTWESHRREEWRSPEGQRESGSWRSLLRTRKLSARPETSTHVRLNPWLSATGCLLSATLLYCYCSEGSTLGSPGGSAGKESACNAGDLGSLPALGRSPGEGKGYPLQYSGLENYSPWGRKESDTTKQLALLRYYSNTQGLVFYTQPLINFRALSLYIILFNLGQRSPTWPSYRF